MPDGVTLSDAFQKALTDWEKRFQQFTGAATTAQERVTGLESQYKLAVQKQQKVSTIGKAIQFISLNIPAIGEQAGLALAVADLGRQLKVASYELLKSIFYTDLYSTVPSLVASGAISSADEALNLLAVPDDLTSDELQSVKDEITQLLSAYRGDVSTENIPELAKEAAYGLEYPELKAPTRAQLLPISIHQISTQELLKSLTAPQIPETTMSEEEWHNYLQSKGWSEEDIDNEVQITTEKLVAEAQNRKNLIASFRDDVATMPEQTMFDVFKQLVVTPPLAVLEMLQLYYQHVSMPAAGFVYGQIPDIKKSVTEYIAQHPEGGRMADAYVYAWRKWEAPGPPVLDFILKYMLMEGLVDPITYIGWGFTTKGLRALGPAGRFIAAGNTLAGEVLELPFDFAKWMAKSVIPKTIALRAAALTRESLSVLDRYFELYTRKPLSFIKPKQMYDAASAALDHLLKNPGAEDDVAMAARVMLAHPPVSKTEVTGWLARLTKLGVSAIDSPSITDDLLLSVDNIFERVFGKEITVDEAAPLLFRLFGITEVTEDVSVLGARLLADRANVIFSRALDFTTERTANRAMRSFARKALRIFEAQVSSEAFIAAQKSGRFVVLLYNINKELIQPWANQINKLVVRPAAESYLCFGLYGPINTLEDVWRSILGGVKPGRMSVERSDILTMGLLDDPEIRRSGLSEMIGPLRDIGEPQRANWILTMSLTPFSVPTYLATRGRLTPVQFAKNTYTTLVELFGGLGSDIRRNFRNGKFTQILADTGGDAYEALVKSVPKDLPSELAGAPRWVRNNLRSDLEAAATTGNLTLDNTALIQTLKDRYTRNRILRAEVNDVIMKYPDISPTARSMILDGFDEKMLLESPDSVTGYMKTVMDAEVDDFLRGPERATAQYDQLTQLLTSLEVTKPEDMTELIVSLHKMSATYGALPDQIMARATVKSRGLPINDRRLQFDAEFDRLYTFMDKAGADIDKVVEKVRLTTVEPARVGVIDWNTVNFSNVGEQYTSQIKKLVDDLPLDIKLNVKTIRFDARLKLTNAKWNPREKIIIIKSPDHIKSLYHELGHSVSSEAMDAGNWTLLRQFAGDEAIDDIYKRFAYLKNTMGFEDARRGLSNYELLYGHVRGFKEIEESFAGSFSTYVRGLEPEVTLPVSRGIKPEAYPLSPKMVEFFRTNFPKTQRNLGLSVAYQGTTQRYLDLITTSRKLVADSKTQDMVFRSGYFADVTQKDLRDPAFWDSFYASEMAHWKNTSRKLAVINSQMLNAVNDINVAAGIKAVVRPAVKVVGRPLAPADVAKLIGTRGDDLSRMLLDTLIPEGDKDYFVEYVLGLVRQGYDEGFDRASIGAVYDQIAASIQVDPTSSSWFRVRQKQIEAMTKDFHDLYNAKLFPNEQKLAVDGFIDSTVARTSSVQLPSDYNTLRQSALDEANKWYYKEYTDYTNANAFDAVMKTLYPFWTYESQRWFWLPRSFIRHPGTLTAWGRWENNTDYGYIHIPGTAIDVNPMRGTVYGPWSTRMMRRDYPEYYDELEGMGGAVQFFDFISRYGFYPNVIYGATMAQLGGSSGQLGGILPSIASTPLDALIAAFPDSKIVSFISERVFPEMFRNYLTARAVDDLGGDGSLLFAKKKAGQELTEEEETMWTSARQTTALHSAAFEQLGFARMRTDQSYELAKASEQFIEEQYGYTAAQQKQLRYRGEKLWDLIGGLDPWETATLQELDFFKYSGSVNPVLPSHQQEILNRIELDWADVMSYSESMRAEVLNLQQDFLTGSERGRLGPDDFLYRVRELYGKRRDYIDEKTKANPLMLLENRKDYYEKYGQVMPVQSPYNELMDLYFGIELEDTVDPATGARIIDWDKFWANREMISDSIPAADKGQWDAFLARNTAPIMLVWQDVYSKYLKKYYQLWDKVLSTYPEDEQKLINEYLFLENTGQQLDRQALIKEVVSAKDGKQLISSFRSAVSNEREALRFTNPILDAWLFYWGRTSSFKTQKAAQVYQSLAKSTGRVIE